jgi:hypothetical protein
MGLLDKLFGGKTKASDTATISVECPHAVLVPRWDNVQDMGREDKATRFMCEACHEEFTPEAAQTIRETMNERLEQSWEDPAKTEEKAAE